MITTERLIWVIILLLLTGTWYRESERNRELEELISNQNMVLNKQNVVLDSIAQAMVDDVIKETYSGSKLGLNNSMVQHFKRLGLNDPTQDIIESLYSSQALLLPDAGILGGAIKIISKDDIHILNHNWVYATAEDGHIQIELLFEYVVNDGGKLEWNLIMYTQP